MADPVIPEEDEKVSEIENFPPLDEEELEQFRADPYDIGPSGVLALISLIDSGRSELESQKKRMTHGERLLRGSIKRLELALKRGWSWERYDHSLYPR